MLALQSHGITFTGMVTDDPDDAVVTAARGEGVVLIVPVGAPPGQPGPVSAGAGRIAVLVGDADDPATRLAAAAMEAELFPPAAPSRTGR